MFVGIVLRNNEMITFENASTAITESPITIAGSSFAVTASTEHIPNTWTITGLSFENGFNSTLLLFIFSAIAILIS
jgi:hypothetical protein